MSYPLHPKMMMLAIVMLGSLFVSTYAATQAVGTIDCANCSSCAASPNGNRTDVCSSYGGTLSCNEGATLSVKCLSNTCAADPTAAVNALCWGCTLNAYHCGSIDIPDNDCFPATAKVRHPDGSVVPMEALQVGDRILVSEPNIYSDVHMFTHRDNQKMSTFYKFTLQDHEPITISPGHYMYVGDKMKTAESVMVDDLLKGSDGKSYRVIAKDKTVERGLYNPQTLHGDIVVDGIVVSTYTKAVHPKLAHAALAPLRMLYRLGWKNPFGNLFDQGNNKLANMLPSGASEF